MGPGRKNRCTERNLWASIERPSSLILKARFPTSFRKSRLKSTTTRWSTLWKTNSRDAPRIPGIRGASLELPIPPGWRPLFEERVHSFDHVFGSGQIAQVELLRTIEGFFEMVSGAFTEG